jgi:hypothetical protein
MQATENTKTKIKPTTKAPCDGAAPPCESPAFCRSYFYTGKLLTEADLNREQRYAADKLRLHYTALHGWGVVCGLMVRPHPQCLDRVVITAGFAVDDCGREIRVLKDCVKELPKPPVPERPYCPPEDLDDGETKGDPEDCEDDDPPRRPREPKGKTYYVCIRYKECQEDFTPLVFDECCGTGTKPNRVCESFEIDLVEETPGCLAEIERRRGCEDPCREVWERLPEACPPTGQVSCIPLAVIRECEYGEPLTERMIHNSIRPLLPSATRLEESIRCLMEKLPKSPPRLTHISRFNWEHDKEYRPHEFLRDFVGSPEAPRGLEIEFDGPVHGKGLNTRTFQALVVRDSGENHEGRRVEVAPARVHHSEDGCRCVLHIDADYARRHLHEHQFDMFISLRCDKVIDEHGMPVDGDLFASVLAGDDDDYVLKYPTGNGVPGGLFESWIRVRRPR